MNDENIPTLVGFFSLWNLYYLTWQDIYRLVASCFQLLLTFTSKRTWKTPNPHAHEPSTTKVVKLTLFVFGHRFGKIMLLYFYTLYLYTVNLAGHGHNRLGKPCNWALITAQMAPEVSHWLPRNKKCCTWHLICTVQDKGSNYGSPCSIIPTNENGRTD